MSCQVTIDGALPRSLGLWRTELRAAAAFFAERSASRVGVPFREVAVVLQRDASSAEVHAAISGVEGPTDVVTQRYDAMPGESRASTANYTSTATRPFVPPRGGKAGAQPRSCFYTSRTAWTIFPELTT